MAQATGKEIVERLAERATLDLLKTGSEDKNFRILNELPLKTKDIEKKFNLSPMPTNRRINQMNRVGLLKKNKRGEKITRTKLGDLFLKLIENVKTDVIYEMANLVK